MNFRNLIGYTSTTSTTSTLTEAKFSEKNIQKVVKLYSKIMGKKMGGEFKSIGFESYNRKWGKGKGLRTMNETGSMLRFNWDNQFAKSELYELTSLDYWSPNNTDFQHPTRTVKFSPELNVIQVLGKVTDALLTGQLREAREIVSDLNTEFELTEKRNSKEKSAWMKQNGFPASYTADDKMRTHVAKKNPGLSAELEIFLGSKETNTFEETLEKAETMLDNNVYADPATVFEDIEDLLSVVASKQWKSLIVCGQGGIGKCLQGDQLINVKGLAI